MADDLIDYLESSRSQIEGKFSRAGSVLESALTMIGQQLEFLGQLNTVLDADGVADATRDLMSTSSDLKALPSLLDARGAHLHVLESKGSALQINIEEMRSLLKYLLVFALNVKITAADNAEDAKQFEYFVQEMRTRIEHGESELNDFEARLAELSDKIRAARLLEVHLVKKAAAMLPGVPNRLSVDAAAIGDHHNGIMHMTAGVSALAQKIQLKVVNALSALQVGDISRQRIEHVQNGLALLSAFDSRLTEQGLSPEEGEVLRRFTCHLLAEQLADTTEVFGRDSGSMLSNMSDMAADARELLSLQQPDGASSTSCQNKLRSLEQSVADAVVLVSDMDQAVESADQIRTATSAAVDELMGRVGAIKGVKEDVQFMALNTTVKCARMGDAGKPLQVIAIELRLYAKKLESIADESLQTLRSLAEAVASIDGGMASTNAKSKLEKALARLRAAADIAENSIGKITAQGTDVVESLSKAEGELNFESELGNVLAGATVLLRERAGEEFMGTVEIAGPLKELLDEIARSYTMARERDVHAQFVEASSQTMLAA